MSECPHFAGWRPGTEGYPDVPTCRILDGGLCEDEHDREHQNIPRKFRVCYRYWQSRTKVVETLLVQAADVLSAQVRYHRGKADVSDVYLCERTETVLETITAHEAGGIS